MANAEREPITGFCGRNRRRWPGAEPLVRYQEAQLPEAESFEAFAHLKKAPKFAVNMPRTSKYGTGS